VGGDEAAEVLGSELRLWDSVSLWVLDLSSHWGPVLLVGRQVVGERLRGQPSDTWFTSRTAGSTAAPSVTPHVAGAPLSQLKERTEANSLQM
jgi:hypothetical protein